MLGADVERDKATQELILFVEKIGGSVLVNMDARGIIPENHPRWAGVFTGNYNLEVPVLSANDQIVTTTATQTLSNKTFAIESIYDANDNEQLILTPVTSAVNYVDISNSATNNPPIIKALGDDANIDLRLEPKGTGKLIIYGDIDVLGTSTTINSTTLDVDD